LLVLAWAFFGRAEAEPVDPPEVARQGAGNPSKPDRIEVTPADDPKGADKKQSTDIHKPTTDPTKPTTDNGKPTTDKQTDNGKPMTGTEKPQTTPVAAVRSDEEIYK